MLAVLRSDRNGKHSTFSLVHGTLHPIHANPLEVIVLLSLYLAVLDDQSKEEQFIDVYTEDCFSVLSKRLVEFPEDTLCILNHNKLMADTDFEALVITGIGAELPYIGAAEEKDTLYKYLKSISTDEEYAEIASRILDEWLSESDGS